MTEILPPSRTAFATYCDDVRREEGNKFSLMGVYHGILMVESLPVRLAKLACVIMVRTPLSQPLKKLRFSIQQEQTELFVQEIEPALLPTVDSKLLPPSLEPCQTVFSVAQFVPFELNSETTLRALVETESEIIRAGGLILKALG